MNEPNLRYRLEGILTALDDLRSDIEAWAGRFVRQLPNDLHPADDDQIDRFRPWEVVAGEVNTLNGIIGTLKYIVDFELPHVALRPAIPPVPHKVRPGAAEICVWASELVGGPRQVAHGDMAFVNIADIWNAILQAKARSGSILEGAVALDALDVANMLEALKIARRYSGSHNIDDYIDGAGYAGCAGEIAERLNQKET